MPQPRIAILLACALLTLSAASATAQGPTGKISGTVRVANGSTVAGAPVTITNQESGAVRIVKTSATGDYEAADLPPGTYTVSSDVQGFRKVIQKDQRISAGAALGVDLALDVKLATEVTVTAMKREDTVSNTPVSVSAPTEEVLRERGVENLEGIAANVAGFSVQNLGPGQSQVSMRGVSSGQIARDQPGVKEQVGAYLDESVLSLSLFTPDIDLFDMSRVEVLRGPQGTLFGSGSLSGTVRYISNQPELAATRLFGELGGSTIRNGNQAGHVKVGVNVPMGNTAALRIAGYYDRFGGFTDAVQPDRSIKKDVNTGNRAGLRAAVAISPNDKLTITPRIVYQKVTTDGWNRMDIYNILANPYTTTRPKVTLGDRQIFTQIDETFSDKFFLADLNIRYKLGDVDLTSITSYTHRDILVVRDAGALTASYTGALIGLPERVYTLNSPLNDATKAQGWTQELRFSGGKDRLKWVVGGFYSDTKRAYNQDLSVTGFEETSGIPTARQFAPKNSLYFSLLDYKLRQFALFGEGTLAVCERCSFTAGLRYYRFSEDKTNIQDGLFGENDDGTPASAPGSTSANGVAPRFIFSYKASEKTTLNAQAARGFRLGGINDPINVPLCTPQDIVTFGGRGAWKDETAWNYEIGSKTRLFDGRGSINASAFYVDISDLQVVVTAGSCSSRLIFNVEKARSVGAELEFESTIGEAFAIALSASYTDSTLRSTVTSTSKTGVVSVVSGIQEGRRLPSVPKFQAAASLNYQQEIKQGFFGYANATYQHVGSRYTQVGDEEASFATINLLGAGSHTIGGPLTQNTFTFDPLLPAYDVFNLRFGVRHGVWDVALFVNNLTDEKALLSLDRERNGVARVGYLTNQPRTFGLTTRVDF